jgi:hypothetical protein
MKTACLFLVLAAAGLFMPARAETRRSTDSLAVEAAGASPGAVAEADEHASGGPIKGVSVKSGKGGGGDAARSASGADEDAGMDPAAKEKAAEPPVYRATQGKSGSAK